jgi:hypothetical protein
MNPGGALLSRPGFFKEMARQTEKRRPNHSFLKTAEASIEIDFYYSI